MDDQRWRLLGIATLAAAVAIGGVVGFLSGSEPLPDGTETATSVVTGEPEAPDQPSEIVVHVAGAVMNPGLVRLGAGTRVADAVAAAGGLTEEAVETAVNLAAPVEDGAQVIVPSAAGGGDAVAAPVDDGLVHVNQADIAELETLPGVGPVLAERIEAHRQDHGPFETVEDLLDVPGIGESKLASMRDHLAIP